MTPRSWLISTSAIPISRRTVLIRSRICAWMVTSSAVVGSSATRMSGAPASAIAIMTRWFCPPENSCGVGREPPFRVRNPDEIEQPLGLGPDRPAGQPAVQRQGLADLRADLEHRVERTRRVLEDHRDAARRAPCRAQRGSRPPVRDHRAWRCRRPVPCRATGRAPRARSRTCPIPTRRRGRAPRPCRSTERCRAGRSRHRSEPSGQTG